MPHLLAPKRIPKQPGKTLRVERKRRHWGMNAAEALCLNRESNQLSKAWHCARCYAYTVRFNLHLVVVNSSETQRRGVTS